MKIERFRFLSNGFRNGLFRFPLTPVFVLVSGLFAHGSLMIGAQSCIADERNEGGQAIESSDIETPSASASAMIAGMSIADCVNDLKSSNRVVRVRAIRTLGLFGADAGEELRMALDHHDTAVRSLAAVSLGQAGEETLEKATDKLRQLASANRQGASSGHGESATSKRPIAFRLGAAFALCKAGHAKEFLPVLIEALDSRERGVACYSADLIGRLGPEGQGAIDPLVRLYKANQPGVPGGDYHLGGAANNALRKVRDSE